MKNNKVRVNISGVIKENTRDNGKPIKCMVKVSLLGQMEKNMLVIIYLIYNLFIGDYIEDKKEGYGEFYWQDGKIYKGNWKDGK